MTKEIKKKLVNILDLIKVNKDKGGLGKLIQKKYLNLIFKLSRELCHQKS